MKILFMKVSPWPSGIFSPKNLQSQQYKNLKACQTFFPLYYLCHLKLYSSTSFSFLSHHLRVITFDEMENAVLMQTE